MNSDEKSKMVAQNSLTMYLRKIENDFYFNNDEIFNFLPYKVQYFTVLVKESLFFNNKNHAKSVFIRKINKEVKKREILCTDVFI